MKQERLTQIDKILSPTPDFAKAGDRALAIELREELRNVTPELYGKLTAYDFPGHDQPVTISFEDGSSVVFYHAFYRREGKHKVVVYTEHCGYHIFRYPSIELLSGVDKTKYIAPEQNKEVLNAQAEQLQTVHDRPRL